MIIISKYFTPKGYSGIALYPFIILKNQMMIEDARLVNHERIHLRQQLELLILPFYIFYGIEFLVRWYHYRNWNQAYKYISFEREAYSNESNLQYIESRKFWQFLKYLRSHEVSA